MAEGQKLTFFEKKQTACPVCNTKFFREDLLSGGGRLIAGNLTRELRRQYDPSKKYGEVRPLLYPVVVCPECYFATFPQDFTGLSEARLKKAEANSGERRDSISHIFPRLDFTSPRTLREGTASYYFAVMCYDLFDKRANPTYKAGLAALRAAWLLSDLHALEPHENWDQLALLFYRKATFYYRRALERESAGQEPFDSQLAFGPDLDKNYGYYGVIYLAAYLDYRYGGTGDPRRRIGALQYDRRMMAKIFGAGKSSKNRPAAILDNAKDVYEQMGAELEKLQPEGQDAAPGGDVDDAFTGERGDRFGGDQDAALAGEENGGDENATVGGGGNATFGGGSEPTDGES